MKSNREEILKKFASIVVESAFNALPAAGAILQVAKAIAELNDELLQELREKGIIREKLDSIAADLSKKSESIVEMMIGDRAKEAQKAYAILAITLLGQFAFAYFSNTGIAIWFTILILFLASTIYLNQAILAYRVRKGLYGTNDYEAREIIEFIFENAEYIDFNGGSGRKRIMPEPEKEAKENIIPEGGITT